MNLGSTTRMLRQNSGLTQSHFASLLGITQTYLSQIETGRKDPSPSLIKKIAKHGGVSLTVFLWYSLTEDDVEKKELFRSFKPLIDKMVESLILKIPK